MFEATKILLKKQNLKRRKKVQIFLCSFGLFCTLKTFTINLRHLSNITEYNTGRKIRVSYPLKWAYLKKVTLGNFFSLRSCINKSAKFFYSFFEKICTFKCFQNLQFILTRLLCFRFEFGQNWHASETKEGTVAARPVIVSNSNFLDHRQLQ